MLTVLREKFPTPHSCIYLLSVIIYISVPYSIYPNHATGLVLYPLKTYKTRENHRFSGILQEV